MAPNIVRFPTKVLTADFSNQITASPLKLAVRSLYFLVVTLSLHNQR